MPIFRKKKITSNLVKEHEDMDIEIRPLDKVLVDGEASCLGMEQSAVEAAIGKGILVGKRYYYFNDEMAIDYNDNKVEFMEVK